MDKITIKWKGIFIVFFALSVLFYVITNVCGQRPFLWDVAGYWSRGERLFENGRLSFNIDSFRGYFFPLYLGVCGKLFNGGIPSWEIVNSIQLSVFFTWIFPTIFENTYKISKTRTVIAASLFVFFCYGVIANPSSDIIAFECCCMAQYFQCKIYDEDNWRLLLITFFIGLFIYWSYNTRTIYLFASIYMLIQSIFTLVNKKGILGILYSLNIMFAVFVASLPQGLINYREYGVFSPKVNTNGLFTQQLLWGLQYQRYDSTTSEVLGTASVYYADRVGVAILQKENIQDSINFAQYFQLMAKYPLEMIGIYFRHMVNMLLPVFPENFISNLDKNKVLSVILFFVLGIVCVVIIQYGGVYKEIWHRYIPMFLPVVFIIPGAVEQRFGLGLYLFIIGVVCYRFSLDAFINYYNQNWKSILIITIFIGGLLLVIWTNMLVSIDNNPIEMVIEYPLFLE